MSSKALYSAISMLAIAGFVNVPPARMHAQQNTEAAIGVTANDIGGAVSGANGPEAGVWVIAETADLPTRFVRIVVTDDRGRFLLPDLPKANYNIWVRGYGLVDSQKVKSVPGKA